MWIKGQLPNIARFFASMFGILVYNLIRRSNDRIQRLQHARIDSELKVLRAQINPHFLFNALNSIKGFILENNVEVAGEYLSNVSGLMRELFEQSKAMMIDLDKEIEVLELYLQIEEMRLDKAFSYEINVDPAIDPNTQLPAMIIQPFVENAIWHGIIPNKRQGKVTVDFRLNDQYLKISVRDNGVGFQDKKPNEKHSSSGIKLVKNRIDLLSELLGQKINLIVSSEKNKGTEVIIELPKKLIME